VFREAILEDEIFVNGLREIVLAEARGEAVEELLRSLVAELVARHGAPTPSDRLFAVKREIDRNPHAPLYVAQLAELASMHPETFTRAFARRFGVTPIRYRLQRRLLEAAHLLINEPHMLVSEVAIRVGFEDLRFFHRSFRGRCGVSPAAYRQWFSEGALGRRRASGIPSKPARPQGEAAA
jgi:transcriptional regulator GlxA family with amidase domain